MRHHRGLQKFWSDKNFGPRDPRARGLKFQEIKTIDRSGLLREPIISLCESRDIHFSLRDFRLLPILVVFGRLGIFFVFELVGAEGRLRDDRGVHGLNAVRPVRRAEKT